jgi:hypothetical protein
MIGWVGTYYNWLKSGQIKDHLIACFIAIVLIAALQFVLPNSIAVLLISAICLLYLIPLRVATIGRSARKKKDKISIEQKLRKNSDSR